MNGLLNIGGTCYLNAVLQILHKNNIFRSNINFNSSNNIVATLREIFTEMDVRQSSARKLVNTLNINLGSDSSGYILSKILDNIPFEYKSNFTITFKSNETVESLIVTEIVGFDLVETLSLYDIQDLSEGLIIDFTGNPDKAFVPSVSFLYKNIRYKLTSVIIYSPGHYYSICLVGTNWVIFNDSSVSKTDMSIEKLLQGRKALVFMYQRCD
jgi:ubiquitin C-terminal hydrolase